MELRVSVGCRLNTGESHSPVLGSSGDGRAEGCVDHTFLHWISPSWLSLMGMEALEKGRQLPWISQPLCILSHGDSHARRHRICRGQGGMRQRGRGMERLQDTCLT